MVTDPLELSVTAPRVAITRPPSKWADWVVAVHAAEGWTSGPVLVNRRRDP